MSSPKKIAANRKNAKKSSGPKSFEGKARTRYNALKSGIYAVHRPLPKEDHKAYRRLSRQLTERYQPLDPVEELLVDQILGHIWRLGRLECAEKAYLSEIDKSRNIRESRLDFVRNTLTSAGRELTCSISNVQLTDSAYPVFQASAREEDVIDQVGATMLEASIPRTETRPLEDLKTQRSVLLDEIIWLENKIEKKRQIAFDTFTSKGSHPCGRRRFKHTKIIKHAR